MNPKNPTSPFTNHRYCLMCGRDNPLSFGLNFLADSDGKVSTTFTGNATLQGYSGIMHGGVLSALLDTAMAHCLLHQNIEAVTGELNVRYLEKVNCNDTLEISAWVDSSLPPLYHLRSTIRIDKRVVCRAKARFMRLDEGG